jgi:signal transduction histidine kinase
MRSDWKSRWPVFEVGVLITAVIIGWAALELYGEQKQIQEQRKQIQALNNQSTKLIQESKAMLRVYGEVQEAFRGQLASERTNVVELLALLPDALQVQEEYLNIAEQLGPAVTNLEYVLRDGVARRSRTLGEDFQRKQKVFADWLYKQQNHLEANRLPARSERLRVGIAQERVSGATEQAIITKNLGQLLQEIVLSYSNFLADADGVLKNTNRWDLAQARQEHASLQAAHLLNLAGEARANAEAAKTFVQSQWLSKTVSRMSKEQQTLLQLSNAPSIMGYTTSLEHWNKVQISAIERANPSLHAIIAGLVVALAVLCSFLAGAIYRRLVVEKIRFELVQSTAENKLTHLQNLMARQVHELGQPLTAINAWVWTLQKTLPAGSDEHEVAGAIRKEIERLDRLVKDFVKTTRPRKPQLVPLKPEPALREILELFGPQFEQKSISLKLDSAVDACVEADPSQLKEVLINLVQNAAESFEDGGAITLRARRDKVALKGRTSDVVVLEVQDNGPGIPPEVEERLFDPFFSTKKDGTGLGLTIANKIVEQHGGELTLRTETGRGTTFRVMLPVYHNGEGTRGENSNHRR